MYKKILVPLDGSSSSECILGHVKTIATGCSVPEVILLRVVETATSVIRNFYVPSEWPAEVKAADDKAKAEAEKYLSGLAGELKQEGIVAKTVSIMSSETDEEILKYATENKVDLIIMSTHGRSGATRWAFGSVADRVIRYSTVPVLIASPKGCRISLR